MKKQNWKLELSQFLIDSSSKPFKWGEFDCVLFAADCVMVQTGIDLASDYRGSYSTKRQAYELIKSKWDGDFNSMLLEHLQLRKGAPNVGDIVVLDRKEGFVCGLYTGSYVTCVSLKGRYDVPLDQNSKVYNVDSCRK